MLVCRESPRQPDLLVLIESSPAIERLTVIIVNFLLQQPFGFGKTLVLHIARCPALSRQYDKVFHGRRAVPTILFMAIPRKMSAYGLPMGHVPSRR